LKYKTDTLARKMARRGPGAKAISGQNSFTIALKQTALGVNWKPKKRGRADLYFCEEDVI
jgi:hypothetical protein